MWNNGKAQTYPKFKPRLSEPTGVGVRTVITSRGWKMGGSDFGGHEGAWGCECTEYGLGFVWMVAT